jgi:hypothetical protein
LDFGSSVGNHALYRGKIFIWLRDFAAGRSLVTLFTRATEFWLFTLVQPLIFFARLVSTRDLFSRKSVPGQG